MINKSGSDEGFDAYGIFLRDSVFNDVSSNYFIGNQYGRDYAVGFYLLDSTHNKINNNYFYSTGVVSIKIDATGIALNHLISGNYILGKNETNNVGILIDNVNVTTINVVGNFIYMPGSSSGIIGISLGDTTDRSILLSSNFVKVADLSSNKTVDFSNYTGMKIIGNIAINGIAPDGTIWDGGYVNSSEDNVFVG
jgi:hypothetical protein